MAAEPRLASASARGAVVPPGPRSTFAAPRWIEQSRQSGSDLDIYREARCLVAGIWRNFDDYSICCSLCAPSTNLQVVFIVIVFHLTRHKSPSTV
jgi:hypothetical protein